MAAKETGTASGGTGGGRGVAMPLITVENDIQFQVHEETIAFLKKQTHPIGVVGVAGLYRTGKSYLLNLLTGNSSSGFAVGSTINACTKGIWIWSEPTYDPEKNIYIYYMDTEGLGSTSRSSTHDSRIFALALLLSSYFIYNSRGVIDGQALEDLSLVASLTQVIQSKSNKSATGAPLEDDSSPNQAFPIFVWVLRDFTLKLEDDQGKKITSNQYLDHCLKPQAGFSDAVVSKNQTRRLISESFRERECVTLVRPAEDENILRNLSQYPLEDLRPEFAKQMKNFLSKVASGVRPKQVMGRTLNGEMFATLVVSYTEALNSGEVPEINSAWTRVISTQCNEAKLNALELYDALILEEISKKLPGAGLKKAGDLTLAKLLPVDYETLKSAHLSAKAKSKHEYRTKLIDPFEETPRHVASLLKTDLRLRFDSLLDANKKSSHAKATAQLQEILEKVKATSTTATATKPPAPASLQTASHKLESYRSLLLLIQDSPTGEAGPMVWEVQNQYLSGRMLEEISSWASSTAEFLRVTETSLTNELHQLELEVSTAQSTVTTKELILKQQELSDERSENELRERIDEERGRSEEELKRKAIEISRYQEMLRDLNEMHRSTMESMSRRQQELRAQLETERESVIGEQKKLGSDRNAIKSETRSAEETRATEREALEKSVEAQRGHISELKRDLERIEMEHTKNLNKKSEEYFKEVTSEQQKIEKERKGVESQLKRELEAEKEIKRKERAELEESIKTKERALRKAGVVVENALIDEEAGGAGGGRGRGGSAAAGGGGAGAGASGVNRQGRGKGKGDKGCKQS